MQGVGMDGIGVERRAVIALGIGEPSVTMRRIGALEKGIHDAWRWHKRGIVPYSDSRAQRRGERHPTTRP